MTPTLTEKRGLPDLSIVPPAQYSPPDMYTPSLSGTPTSSFSPFSPTLISPSLTQSSTMVSPILTEEPVEIVMGGRVTRSCSSSSYSSSGSRSSDELWDEKRAASIEVPGIILTEPYPEPHKRSRVPSSPKSILLLPPTVVPIPEMQSRLDSFFSLPRWTLTPRQSCIAASIRSGIILGVVGMGIWHLYTSLSMGAAAWGDETSALVEEVVAP